MADVKKKTQLSDPNSMAKALQTVTNFANSFPAETKKAMTKPVKKESLLSKTKKRLAKVYGGPIGGIMSADADKVLKQVKELE
jgi:hypothetical protein